MANDLMTTTPAGPDDENWLGPLPAWLVEGRARMRASHEKTFAHTKAILDDMRRMTEEHNARTKEHHARMEEYAARRRGEIIDGSFVRLNEPLQAAQALIAAVGTHAQQLDRNHQALIAANEKAVKALHENHSEPAEIIRDAIGRASHIRRGQSVMEVVYGRDGRIVGTRKP